MKRQVEYIIIKVEPTEFPVFETKEQEQEYRDKITAEIKLKFPDNDIIINFVWKHLK